VRAAAAPLFAFVILAALPAWAGEPLAGKWLLKHQEVAGKETTSNPLTLAITPSGKAFDFTFFVTINNTPVVSLKFTSPLDGTEAEVAGGDGKKMGTAKVSRDGGSYKLLMEGSGRPAVTTKMTVSPDGKTLTSESDVTTPSGVNVHTEQVFDRQ
jgi:hypothetical protein